MSKALKEAIERNDAEAVRKAHQNCERFGA